MARRKQSKFAKKRVIKVIKTGGIMKIKDKTVANPIKDAGIEDICDLLGKIWIDKMELDS